MKRLTTLTTLTTFAKFLRWLPFLGIVLELKGNADGNPYLTDGDNNFKFYFSAFYHAICVIVLLLTLVIHMS